MRNPDLSQHTGESLDRQCRDILKAGTSTQYTGGVDSLPKPSYKQTLKYHLKKLRIYLAETIGGEDLHEHCGDY